MSDDANRREGATAIEALDYIVRAIVDNPDDVEVDVDDGDDVLRLDVRVGDGDMGRVIGKRGRVAHAIRTVVRAAAANDDVDVDVEFVD